MGFGEKNYISQEEAYYIFNGLGYSPEEASFLGTRFSDFNNRISNLEKSIENIEQTIISLQNQVDQNTQEINTLNTPTVDP